MGLALRQAMLLLPEHHRDVLNVYYFDGQPLPKGKTAAGARYYTGLYLNNAKQNLYFRAGPGGTPGARFGLVIWPAA
jgi:hypothetical protein